MSKKLTDKEIRWMFHFLYRWSTPTSETRWQELNKFTNLVRGWELIEYDDV